MSELPAYPNMPAYDMREAQAAELTQRIEQSMDRSVSRRTVLAVGGVILASTLLKLDNEVLRTHWNDVNTTVQITRPCAIDPPLYGDAALGSPGFGGIHGSGITDAYRATGVFPREYPLSFFQYSNRSLTRKDISNNGYRFAQALDLQTITLHGESEGGLIGMTAALAANRHVRLAVFNCSPFDIDDAYESAGAKFAAKLGELGLYHGGIIGKYATCLLDKFRENGPKHLISELVEAGNATMNGADPRLLESQLIFLDEARLHKQVREFRRIITSDTVMIYTYPRDTDSDGTVHDLKALHKYQSFASDCNTNLLAVPIDAPGHANTKASVHSITPHIRDLPIKRAA